MAALQCKGLNPQQSDQQPSALTIDPTVLFELYHDSSNDDVMQLIQIY